MRDVLLDTILDSLKILPFLFIAFIIIEYIEHKLNNKKNETSNSGFRFLLTLLNGQQTKNVFA